MTSYTKNTTRTRFAPSPTGYLHVGGIRTALFAYLLAKQADGQFILRLEDTDRAREVEGSAEHVIASLHALGLDNDEGPVKGGPHAPYRQSERLDTYKTWAQKLIDAGRAYADPYTPAEVQAFREQAHKSKKPFLYRNHRPDLLGIELPAWDGSQPLRFKSDPKHYTFHDEVMGEVSTGPEVIDDFILIKTDGFPTYNFAHIVDDAEMQITHVIRGQEFISSMPNYLNLYEALGFDMKCRAATNTSSTNKRSKPEPNSHSETSAALPYADECSTDDRREALSRMSSVQASGKLPLLQLPIFAHMPHIMNEQGNKKLGKRDGAKDVLDYIRDGYLPETMVSFIATMGWNDGTEQEIFTLEELIEKFKLSRVQRSGARFDEKRLLWMNGDFIRKLSLNELAERVMDYWPSEAHAVDEEYRMSALALAQDRMKTLKDLPKLTSFFFTQPEIIIELITENKQLRKYKTVELKALLTAAKNELANIEVWSVETVQATLNKLLEKTEQKPGILFSLIRIATTWAPFSPGLDETLALLGKHQTLVRLNTAIDAL